MILINLLPHREAARRRRAKAFFVGLGVSVAVGAVFSALWLLVIPELTSLQAARNAFLKSEITVLENQIKDIATLIAEVRAKPGTVSIGHSGNGTTNHVSILRMQLNEDIKFNIVPYRGSGPGINDLLAGNIDCFADQLTSSMPHIKAGKLRPLVNFGLERIPDLPDVPTLKEAGFKPFEGGTTAGVFVRRETPPEIVARLNTEFNKVMRLPELRDKLLAQGFEPVGSTPAEFAEYIRAETAKWAKVVKATGMKID